MTSIKQKSNPSSNQVEDSSEAFALFASSSIGLPQEIIEDRFNQIVAPSNPEYYQYRLAALNKTKGGAASALKTQVQEFESYRDRYKTVRDNLLLEIPKAIQKFRYEFPDFDGSNKIYVVHSLGELNGGTRAISGKRRFLLGIDVIAQIHFWTNQGPFLIHELFHLYHMEKNPALFQTDSVGLALWKEGLATYVSEKLSSNATPAEIMLEIPNGLFENCQANLKTLSTFLKKNLKAVDEDIYTLYFLMTGGGDKIPKRAGYCVGYFAAKEVAKGLSLSQMVSLSEAEVYSRLSTALNSLSDVE